MVIRVVHWGTGNTGRHGLRQIIEHPALELVGVGVHHPAKVGRDAGAGALCGLPDVGVVATIATSARVVNAIPAVCEAPPGLLSFFDIPPVVGKVLALA
jgi:hypothetical protein